MLDTQTCTEISEVVKTYVEGMCLNDPAKLRDAMHEKLCCIGHYEGGLEWDTRDAFIAAVNEAVDAPDPSPWHVINAISMVGDVATGQEFRLPVWRPNIHPLRLTGTRHRRFHNSRP